MAPLCTRGRFELPSRRPAPGHDRDYTWDGNRVDLPPGAQKVSDIRDATRQR